MALHVGYSLAGFVITFVVSGIILAQFVADKAPPLIILIWMVLTIISGCAGALIGWGLA